MNIKAFMVKAEKETKEVKFDRFEEPFVIATITERENDQLKKASRFTKKSRSGVTRELNTDVYTDKLVVACVQSPDLKNAELQAFFGTEGSDIDTLKAMLVAGEYATLTEEILELNKFDEEFEVKEEVKK